MLVYLQGIGGKIKLQPRSLCRGSEGCAPRAGGGAGDPEAHRGQV